MAYASDQIADALIILAAKIRDGKPFETYYQPRLFLSFSDMRFDFAEATRSVGGGKKTVNDYNLEIQQDIGVIDVSLNIARDAVCKKVIVTKEVEEWQCEPVLATESV